MPNLHPENPSAPHCRECNYPLTGLLDVACPECGTAFDLDDPATFIAITQRSNKPMWCALAGGIIGLLIFILILRSYFFPCFVAASTFVGLLIGAYWQQFDEQ